VRIVTIPIVPDGARRSYAPPAPTVSAAS
jgi:hypothetical protein